MLRLLFLVSFCFPNVLLEQRRILDQRKPFFERFRRLEEQFRRFQELTLTRLQGIAENYNISYNIDARFDNVAVQQQMLTEAVNASSEVTQTELNTIKLWLKKLQKKSKKQDVRISSLEQVLTKNNKQVAKEQKDQNIVISNLTSAFSNQKRLIDQLMKENNVLQKRMALIQRERSKVPTLEEQLRSGLDNKLLPPSALTSTQPLNNTLENSQAVNKENESKPVITVQQNMKKLQAKHEQTKRLQKEHQQLIPLKNKHIPMIAQPTSELNNTGVKEEIRANLQTTTLPSSTTQTVKQQLKKELTSKDGSICNVDYMLVFPNSSIENFVTFTRGLRETLLELSICSWIRINSSYVGTILSYATEENDNKLVIHGRNEVAFESLHFVIGDPTFRELPVVSFLDGNWHHTCFIWSSIQGKYWYYVDRRLTSTGSRFQKGYEIPPGGSLILGQEQDSLGGGFDSSEAFVGYLAGFAMWNHALSPGEVSSIATGQSLGKDTILTLADASSLHGHVQKVHCKCLEQCL